METTNLTHSEVVELNSLRNVIEFRKASLNDFHRYSYLLNKGGVSNETISKMLKKYNYHNFDDYYTNKNKIKDSGKENEILGVILAFSLFALLMAALKK